MQQKIKKDNWGDIKSFKGVWGIFFKKSPRKNINNKATQNKFLQVFESEISIINIAGIRIFGL
jgi:hypothetical protein